MLISPVSLSNYNNTSNALHIYNRDFVTLLMTSVWLKEDCMYILKAKLHRKNLIFKA